jgi:hypothetical protein|tara:strand:- start:15945 stop:16232 length:288 start_codon:yes stop_codon:yes gene_type:complete
MHNQLLSLAIEKNTKSLFKGFLFLVEDLQSEHTIHFNKLRQSLPEEYHSLLNQANYMDEEKLNHIRKRILDIGNDAIRNIESELNKFTIHFNFKQ